MTTSNILGIHVLYNDDVIDESLSYPVIPSLLQEESVNCNRLQHGYSSTAKANIDNSSNLQW
jgi:hypothetical protein